MTDTPNTDTPRDDDIPPTTVERVISISAGLAVLVTAVLALGWAGHWTVVWLQQPEGFPGNMITVLLVAVVSGAVVSVGAWRLLLVGIKGNILGLSPGKLVLAASVLGFVIGTLA